MNPALLTVLLPISEMTILEINLLFNHTTRPVIESTLTLLKAPSMPRKVAKECLFILMLSSRRRVLHWGKMTSGLADLTDGSPICGDINQKEVKVMI